MKTHRRATRARCQLLLALACLFALAGCKAQAPTGAEGALHSAETTTAEGSQAATVDMAATLETLAATLPADTVALALFDLDAFLSSELLRTLGQNMSNAEVAALRSDLSSYLTKHLGADPTRASWLAVAAGEGRWFAILVGGPLERADDLASLEVAGQTAHQLKRGDALLLELGKIHAVVPDAGMAEALLGGAKAPLGKTPRWAALTKASGAVASGALVVLVHADNPVLQSLLARELPPQLAALDAAAFSLGSAGLQLAATGSHEELEALEAMVTAMRSSAAAEIDAQYEVRDSLAPPQGIAAILGHHLDGPLFAAMAPRFEEGLVRLELGGDGAPLLLGLAGVSAAVAVPAFVKYIRLSKTAEAQENLKSLADGALAYYQEEHVADPTGMTVTTQVYPLAAEPVCSAAFDPSGEKIDPLQTAWSDDPWRALRFALSRPHYFQYCYQSAPDQKAFAVWADAALGGGGAADTRVCLTGTTTGYGPEISRPVELAPGEPCPVPASAP